MKLGNHIREALGKVVHEAFVKEMQRRHDEENATVKMRHLSPNWDGLFDWERELDRSIGEAVYFNMLSESQINALNIRETLEQAQVQLAGCLVAAEGGVGDDVVAAPGSYGWSVAYQKVLDLRRAFDEVSSAMPKLPELLELAAKIPAGNYVNKQTGAIALVYDYAMLNGSIPVVLCSTNGHRFAYHALTFAERYASGVCTKGS